MKVQSTREMRDMFRVEAQRLMQSYGVDPARFEEVGVWMRTHAKDSRSRSIVDLLENWLAEHEPELLEQSEKFWGPRR